MPSSSITSLRSQEMSYAKQMLETYPTSTADANLLAAAIDALNDCAQACTADADADLGVEDVTSMITCLRLCLDCADACPATSRATTPQTAYDPELTTPLLHPPLRI